MAHAFEMATKRTTSSGVIGTFKVDEEVFEVRALKDSHLAYLIAAVNDTSDGTRLLVKVLDFTSSAMTKESAARFEKMVLDPDAGLELSEVMECFQEIVTLVAENPTGGASASSPSPKRSGRASTATSRASASTP